MLTVFQDIMFAETPVSSFIRSVLPLIFRTKKHAELSLEEVFSMYRQSTKNSFSLLPWLTISFTFWSTVLCWLLKRLGPPHFKKDSPQAGHSFQACMVPHLLQLCLLLQFRAPQPLERDCLPPVEAWFVLRQFVVSASTCCSSILAAPFIPTPYVPVWGMAKYLGPSAGLASVCIAAALLEREEYYFGSDHVTWFSKLARQRKRVVAECCRN